MTRDVFAELFTKLHEESGEHCSVVVVVANK